MDLSRNESTEKEQDWIQKYRAALNEAPATGSRAAAMRSLCSKVAERLMLTVRSILRTGNRAIPAVSKLPRGVRLMQPQTATTRKPQSIKDPDLKPTAVKKRPAPQRRRKEQAS